MHSSYFSTKIGIYTNTNKAIYTNYIANYMYKHIFRAF